MSGFEMHPHLADGIRSSTLNINTLLESKLSQDTKFAVQQYLRWLGGKLSVN